MNRSKKIQNLFSDAYSIVESSSPFRKTVYTPLPKGLTWVHQTGEKPSGVVLGFIYDGKEIAAALNRLPRYDSPDAYQLPQPLSHHSGCHLQKPYKSLPWPDYN